MSRILTNVPSLIAQRNLGMQNQKLNTSLERLSTGLRINRGGDDPAGLIASENLRAERTAISAAIKNADRAEQVINVAEGGLQEVSALMLELQGLISSSANDAGTSPEEIEANQLQIDSILQTIDRIANATNFQGQKLLNGSFDYTTSGISSSLSDVRINAAKLPNGQNSFLNVSVDVLTSAQTAGLFLSTGSTFDANDGNTYTIEITGALGTQQFTFASGTTQTAIVSAINTFKGVTGVSAAVDTTDAARLSLRSTSFGSAEFVNVKKLEGDLDDAIFESAASTSGSDEDKGFGRDASVLINGNVANSVGLKARISAAGLDIEVTLSEAFNTNGSTDTFQITGGGADFNLSPDVNLAGKVSLGIETVTSGNLGSDKNGFLSAIKSGGAANAVTGDLDVAQRIIEDSIKQISSLRGRLGAFQSNVVGSTRRSLGVTLENTAAAESAIRDTDFAEETANLTRQQILVQATNSVLSIANSAPQSVLALLG